MADSSRSTYAVVHGVRVRPPNSARADVVVDATLDECGGAHAAAGAAGGDGEAGDAGQERASSDHADSLHG